MMNPTPTYMAFLAESLVAALNPQLASVARSQLASRIEAEAARWVGELIGWQTAFGGTFTTGGNESNLSALAMALSARFPAVIEDGIGSIGAQPVFYASVEAHHSLDKCAGLLGLGRKALRRIPVSGRLQLEVPHLQAAINQDLSAGRKPFCVVATRARPVRARSMTYFRFMKYVVAIISGSTSMDLTARQSFSRTSTAISYRELSKPIPSLSILINGWLCLFPRASF
jgi:hypothetical protein